MRFRYMVWFDRVGYETTGSKVFTKPLENIFPLIKYLKEGTIIIGSSDT